MDDVADRVNGLSIPYSPLNDTPALHDLIRKFREQEASRSLRQQELLKSIIDRRNSEIASLARSRDDDVACLSAEISALQKQVSELQAENLSLKYLASAERSPWRLRSPHSMIDPNQPAVPKIVTADDGPSIDVKMIYPGLEGIHLRPEAVSKKTFSDTEPYDANKSISPTTKISRGASKEETMQVLKAPEERRLTINAGHTPNHSISHLPLKDPAQEARAMATVTVEEAAEAADRDGPLPEPVEDHVLRGPLMLRNDKDFDEAFLRQVKDRLEMHQKSQENSAGPSSPTITSNDLAAVKKL